MHVDLQFVLLVFSLFLQLSAAFFSYSIYLRHHNYFPWLAITFGLLLMSFRRIISVVFDVEIFSNLTRDLELFDRLVIPLAVSLLFFYALWSIKAEFDSADASVEKKVQQMAWKRAQAKG